MASLQESLKTVDQGSSKTTEARHEGTEEDNGPARVKTASSESRAPDPSNPYHFPEFILPSGLHYNGASVIRCPVKDDHVTHIKKVQALPMREDDAIITAYPKCGTHWVAEILHMLTTGQTEFSSLTKEYKMLEFCDDLPFLETLPSPRVLNSHLNTVHLPREIVEKKVKMVHIIRNPKDVAVSMYHHLRQSAPEQFTFDSFLKGYHAGKLYISFSHQFDYLRQMAHFEQTHPDHPIMHIHYEDLKQAPASVIKRLSQFLGTPATDDFCQKVASACGFNSMKQADQSRDFPENVVSKDRTLNLYRKGVVGDWKNQFTVAQNEAFEEFISAESEQGFGFTFRNI